MIYKLKLCVLILVFSTPLIAQNNHAIGLAFGKNYMSAAYGIDAFFLNPGNLALHTKGYEISFLSPGLGVSNSSFSASDYGRFFTDQGHKGQWSGSDKNEIRDILAEGLTIPFYSELNIFSMVYKNMGFGIEFVTGGALNTKSKEFAEIALFGADLTPNYNFDKKDLFEGAFFSAFRYSFAYGHILRKRYFPLKLENITIGAKISLYTGVTYGRVTNSNLKIKRSNASGEGTDDEVLEYNMKFTAKYTNPGNGIIFTGTGLGLDIASSATFDKDWHFSVLIENLPGFINWNKNTRLRTVVQKDSVYIFNDDGVDRKTETDTSVVYKSFTSYLPTSLHIGANYRLLKNLLLTAQYRQGLNERLGNVYIPRVGVGAEYRPIKWLPLRTGITVGGKNLFLMGLGAGVDLEIFEFNLAYAMRETFLWPNFSNGAYLAFDFKFKF